MSRLLLFVALLMAPAAAHGAARFWLSAKAAGVPGPESPALAPTVGDTVTLYLWGRPEPGRQFHALSVDVISSVSGLDFVDGTFVLHNEIDGTTDRFEHTFDSSTTDAGGLPTPLMSTTPPEDVIDFGDIDDLVGLRGFTLSESAAVRGPGPHCLAGETGCEVAADSEPAWLIAQFDVRAVTPGVVELNLGIGDRGVVERVLADGDYDLDGEVAAADAAVWVTAYGGATALGDGNADGVVNAADYTVWRDHLGDTATVLSAASTGVVFGSDTGGDGEPVYNASTDKQAYPPMATDDADAVFTISAPAFGVPEPGALVLALLTLPISNRRRRPTRGGRD